jgi:hypothetical protein
MAMWVYRCYNDGNSPHLWKGWYDGHAAYRGTHDAIFDILEQQVAWKEPWAKFFDKPNRIIEVRLTGDVKYRILGFYGQARMEFIVLGICSHKQRVYDPPDIRKTAVRRKSEIEKNPAKALRCVRPQ